MPFKTTSLILSLFSAVILSQETNPHLVAEGSRVLSSFKIIFIIILFVFLSYCIMGVIYNLFIMKKPMGWGILPNGDFWIKIIKCDARAEIEYDHGVLELDLSEDEDGGYEDIGNK